LCDFAGRQSQGGSTSSLLPGAIAPWLIVVCAVRAIVVLATMQQPLWRLTCLMSLAFLPLGTASFGQQPLDSLKDVARRLGGTVTSTIDVEPPSMSFKELVQTTDLVVHARLATMTTRLADDESTVFRDFTVAPITFIKQPVESIQPEKPNQLPTLTFRQAGGRMTVDGLTLATTTNFEDRVTPMAPGEEYVLFLSPAHPSPSTTMSPGKTVFQLTSLYWGAFPVRNGQVGFTNWTRRGPERMPDTSFVAFIAHTRGLLDGGK
jgi:hypothetical protein